MMQVSAESTAVSVSLWKWPPVMLSMNAFCFSASAEAMLLVSLPGHSHGSSPSIRTGPV